MAYWKYCDLGRDPKQCVITDIAGVLPQGISGNKQKRLCPVHDDREASLYIDVGIKGQRVVWCCHAGCHPEDVREGLIRKGIDERCLGDYCKVIPLRTVVPGLRVAGHSPGIIADAKRWQAMLKLPADLNGKLMLMCRQAIAEGDGDLPGDPSRLLPYSESEFKALAARAGIERSYRYRLWKQWKAGLDALPSLSSVA